MGLICEDLEYSTPGPSIKERKCPAVLEMWQSVGMVVRWSALKIMAVVPLLGRPKRWGEDAKALAKTPETAPKGRYIASATGPIHMVRSYPRNHPFADTQLR